MANGQGINYGLLADAFSALGGRSTNYGATFKQIQDLEEERRRRLMEERMKQQAAAGLLGIPPTGPYRQENQALANLAAVAPGQIIQGALQSKFKRPATTNDIKNFQFAKQNGFTGSFSDFLQSQVPGGVTMNVPPTEIPPEEVTNIDIPTAAQGDLSGIASRGLNVATGLFGGAYDEDALREAANLRAVNLGAQVPLTKSLSDKGSVYTQQNIARLLPQPGDTNAQMVAKMESLIPLLRRQIDEAKKVAVNPNAQAAYRTNAREMLSSGPAALAAYEKAVENYRRREGQGSPVTRRTQRRVVRDPNTGEMRFVD
tara:strand:+ start:1579 stop:2523 length:945 start_codon:yes stop_codon:yes gene_type:complete